MESRTRAEGLLALAPLPRYNSRAISTEGGRPMRYSSRGHRALALMVTVTIGTAGIPAFAAPIPARISGRILQMGTSSGVRNAIVKVALRPDARVYESTRTDEK